MSAESGQLTTGADGAYFEGLLANEVRTQVCSGCGRVHWPAVFRCPDCGSWEHSWRKVAPKGTIFSWTRTRHDFGGPEAFTLPFVSLVVSLDGLEHVRLIGTLDAPDSDVRIGARVEGRVDVVEFLDRNIPALVWSLV